MINAKSNSADKKIQDWSEMTYSIAQPSDAGMWSTLPVLVACGPITQLHVDATISKAISKTGGAWLLSARCYDYNPIFTMRGIPVNGGRINVERDKNDHDQVNFIFFPNADLPAYSRVSIDFTFINNRYNGPNYGGFQPVFKEIWPDRD